MSNIYNIICFSAGYDKIQLKFNDLSQKPVLSAFPIFKMFEITSCLNVEEGC